MGKTGNNGSSAAYGRMVRHQQSMLKTYASDKNNAPLKHALREAARGFNVLSYHDGALITIILNAQKFTGGRVKGTELTRAVRSSGLARAVIARFGRDLETFTHLTPAEVLDASVLYAEAAWRHANRRIGRRVP